MLKARLVVFNNKFSDARVGSTPQLLVWLSQLVSVIWNKGP
jgi:hypothetical protein